MKTQWFTQHGRIVLGVTVASVLALSVGQQRASAQQGKYITEAAARLTKLIDAANADGYKLRDNSFSIGGGWLKQSQTDWIALYKINLAANKDYRFLASGDFDARDVDLEVLDPSGKVVASDTAVDPNAVVNYRPTAGGMYTVRIRLYASDKNLPCVCLGIMMVK